MDTIQKHPKLIEEAVIDKINIVNPGKARIMNIYEVNSEKEIKQKFLEIYEMTLCNRAQHSITIK